MVYAVLDKALAEACYKATMKLRGKYYSASQKNRKTLMKDIIMVVEQTAGTKGGELPLGWKKVSRKYDENDSKD
jgi:hypothetical protein